MKIRACATYQRFLLHSCTKCHQFLTVSRWLRGDKDTNAHALKHANLLRAFVCVCFPTLRGGTPNPPRAIGDPASHKHKRSSGGNWCWVYLHIVHNTCLCVCSEFSIFWPCWREKKNNPWAHRYDNRPYVITTMSVDLRQEECRPTNTQLQSEVVS